VIFAILVFIVIEIFEYLVFGSFLFFSSNVLDYAIPTSILYSIIFGIVFAVAQCIFTPKTRVCSPHVSSFSSYVQSSDKKRNIGRRKKIVAKGSAKKRKRK
jgi:hypothetical protein